MPATVLLFFSPSFCLLHKVSSERLYKCQVLFSSAPFTVMDPHNEVVRSWVECQNFNHRPYFFLAIKVLFVNTFLFLQKKRLPLFKDVTLTVNAELGYFQESHLFKVCILICCRRLLKWFLYFQLISGQTTPHAIDLSVRQLFNSLTLFLPYNFKI